ncbi:hypothetical protein CgunFtcFv8_015271 [Champsocephalus gunnari]|uniref:Uncharacterized protein n=1 Tax=Champsocephalus gunnari TaxID=52237 RepID=A0AAN8GZM0_CHAGU|nr:hypothetical protein CgunFtcFv8_015271 [Champsocephalus gunnari]
MAMLLCGDVDSGPLKGEPAGGRSVSRSSGSPQPSGERTDGRKTDGQAENQVQGLKPREQLPRPFRRSHCITIVYFFKAVNIFYILPFAC